MVIFQILLLSVKPVISKERNTVRASNPRASLTWTDNTSKVEYGWSKRFTSTKSTYFCQLMTTALLDSVEERENGCRNCLMTSLHESYLAGFGFDIAIPELKTLQICGAANCSTGLGEYACMYVYVCACSSVCVPERACVYVGDGRTEDGGMGGFKCACVCVRACVRPCLCVCDPVCENGLIDARSDG